MVLLPAASKIIIIMSERIEIIKDNWIPVRCLAGHGTGLSLSPRGVGLSRKPNDFCQNRGRQRDL